MQRAPLPPGLLTLADHETLAQQNLPAAIWAYVAGGAADGHTLQANNTAWQRLRLRPRVLPLSRTLDTHIQLWGRSHPTPLLVAPMAQHNAVHPDAERATALAASALGVGLVLSSQSHNTLEDVAHTFNPGQGPLWFQLTPHPDKAWVSGLALRAEAAGYQALVLTVDAPIQGVRDSERRAGWSGMPSNAMAHPEPPRSGGTDVATLLAQSWTWDDVVWLQSQTTLPLLLKGITHPEDARQAARLGVAGVVVSNHGARVLDTVPATAEVLQEVAQAVQGDCAVLVDGGIRRGTDVVKALALGAQAVLIGRPVLYGLANAGATGVAHVLRTLLDETQAAMALCGRPTIESVTFSMLDSLKKN
jgi:4-hydroxymandelate oxidase